MRDQQETSLNTELLNQRAGVPIWNAVHKAQVEDVLDDGVRVRIQVGENTEPILAAISPQEFDGKLPEKGATFSVYLEDPPKSQSGAEIMPTKASLTKAQELLELSDLLEKVKKSSQVEGFVTGPIKGGFSVALLAKSREDAEKGLGLRAFLPLSQASLSRGGVSFSDREPYLFSVKELEPKAGNIIVSRRDVLLKEKRAKEKEFWEGAKVGDVVTGVVRNIVSYGAFIDASGVDGLCHISDMAWDKQPKVEDILHMGQTITAKILELDKKARKLKLGLKQLTPDPWQSIKAQFKPGMDLEGDVVAIADFGVFVHLAEGIEGLIHLSEMSWQRIKHPSHRFHIGDRVKARVLSVDQGGHRISLSTKALEQNPIEKLAEKFPVGAVLKTHIAEIRDFGVFVELDENVLGLVHMGEMSWTKRVEHPSELFEEGQEVEVVVLGFDSDRQRVSCSIKRTQPDPWVIWKDKYAKGSRHDAVVKRIVSAGAECELELGLLGFCPTRELSSDEHSRPQDIAKVGQTIGVEVIHFDPREHRITLSVRARIQKETKEDYQMYLKKQSQEGSAKVTLKDALDEGKSKDSV